MLYKNKKSVIKKITLVMILLIVIGGGSFIYINKNESKKSTITPESPVNLAPPTETEKKAGDDIKAEVAQKQAIESQPNQTPSNTKRTVKPQITYAGQYGDQIEIGAYVSDIYEDGGRCTVKLVGTTNTQTVSVLATKNTNSVDCPAMIIKRSDLSAGKWQATVSYESSSASGVSEVKAFEVR